MDVENRTPPILVSSHWGPIFHMNHFFGGEIPKRQKPLSSSSSQKKSKTKVHIQFNPKIFEPWWIREIPKQKKSIQSKIPVKKMVQRPSHPIPSPKRPCCWVRWCVPNRKDLMNNKFWEPPWFVWVLDLDPKGVKPQGPQGLRKTKKNTGKNGGFGTRKVPGKDDLWAKMERPKKDVRKKWYRYIDAWVVILSLQLEDDNMTARLEALRFRQYLGTQPGYQGQGWEGTEKSQWWSDVMPHLMEWLDGAFRYFLVSSLLTWVDDPIWRAYFFRWVECTN